MGIYWTRQNEKAWAYAQEVGYLEGNPEYTPPTHIEAYKWMISQMSIRLLKYNGEYPIWLFISMPEFEKGELVLEIELDDNDVLLSDFEDFQDVINNLPIGEERNIDYDDYFYEECSELKEAVKRKHWEKIFDLKNIQSFQGTTGRIELNKIRRVINK